MEGYLIVRNEMSDVVDCKTDVCKCFLLKEDAEQYIRPLLEIEKSWRWAGWSDMDCRNIEYELSKYDETLEINRCCFCFSNIYVYNYELLTVEFE